VLSEGDAENELVRELRAIAKAGESDDFTITRDGVGVRVSYSSGSSSHANLSVAYTRGAAAPTIASPTYRGGPVRAPRAPRPLRIELVPERSTHLMTKESGVDREVQTGDAAFDREVYIDTRAPDEAVLFTLAPEEVRAAVRALFATGVQRVRLDEDGRHTAHISTFASREAKPGRGAKMVDAMVALARHVPWIESAGDPPPDRLKSIGATLSVAAVVGFFAQAFVAFPLAPAGCVTSDDDGSSLHCIEVAGSNCCAPLGYGALFGIPLGLVIAILAVRSIRGRSDASDLRMTVGFGVFGLVVDACIVVAMWRLWR
jgi:hypothetical protein